MPDHPSLDYQYQLRVRVRHVADVDTLRRDHVLEVIHVRSRQAGRVGCPEDDPRAGARPELLVDVLAPASELARLREAGWPVDVTARLLQPEDLPTQVSQTNRWTAEVERLRRARE